MSNDDVVTFRRGKVSRKELELPTLHFVVMDQWIDVIGERALFAWLKMYTWCKRDEDTDKNQWEEARIPTSFNQIIKRLGVGRTTFYKQILRPLWNVGLIDIEEYHNSENKGSKPMNVVVYKYPQNNKTLAHESIEEVRDYDKDYHSRERTFAKKGGRKKVQLLEGTQSVQGGVPNEYRGVYRDSTGGCTQLVPNNSLNSINNSFNINNNPLNSSNNFYINEKEKEDFEKQSSTTTNTLEDTDTKEIIDFWVENGFGTSTYSQSALLAYLDDDDFDNPKAMIIFAMQLACDNKKQSFGYVRAILHNWITKGIRTLGEVKQHEQKRNYNDQLAGKNNMDSVSYGSIPKEDISEEEQEYWDKRNEEANANMPDYIT